MANEEFRKLGEALINIATGENIQKYVFGYKRSGHPRAAYDIFKDVVYKPKKKKGKKKKYDNSGRDIYKLISKTRKGNKKKKKKNHWKF